MSDAEYVPPSEIVMRLIRRFNSPELDDNQVALEGNLEFIGWNETHLDVDEKRRMKEMQRIRESPSPWPVVEVREWETDPFETWMDGLGPVEVGV